MTKQMKLDDAINGVKNALLGPAASGCVYGVLLSSEHQAKSLECAFAAAGLPVQETESLRIHNTVPGFVALSDEHAARRLTNAFRGMDCSVTYLHLNPEATSGDTVVKAKFVEGGLGFSPHR